MSVPALQHMMTKDVKGNKAAHSGFQMLTGIVHNELDYC